MALVITSIFLIAEFAGALYTNSLALLADSGHMVTDVAALYLGDEAGIFKKYGIDLKVNMGTTGAALVPSVMSGEYNFAFSSLVSLLQARDKGLHVFFIQRAEVDDQGIAAVAKRLEARSEGGRYDLGIDELGAVVEGASGSGPGRGDDGGDRARAIIGHLARAPRPKRLLDRQKCA